MFSAMAMSKEKGTSQQTYFPNLNALRFIAASMVLVGHTEQIKGFHNYKCYLHEFPFIFQGGHLAVIFFFVLSGFLITHIIKTKLNSNKFSVSNFYKKRVVRIWPLYYFIIVMGLYVIPQLGFMAHNSEWVDSLSQLNSEELKWTTIFYFVVLPNLSLFYGTFEYLGHTWSIGVEEQFYLIWPLLMKWFRKNTLGLLLGVIGIVWSLRWLFGMLEWNVLHVFLNIFRIDSMAIGGLSALVILQYPKAKKLFVNTWTELLALATVVGFYGFNIHFGDYSDEAYSILFSLIIVNAACNSKTIIRLEKIIPLGYLGQVSYGIYMYHPITSMLSLLLFQAIWPSYMASFTSNIVFYGLVFFVSSAISILSYELVEKRIMNWGRKRWLNPV
jgi:peptidoglycan/LPS O-acetylase OafA/YrhL